ncbi:MAG: thioredoxin family protein [Bacteroidaceae bacterium]|nr:thioredoxin family protein [Bacteroidaceae bacterium]
MKKFYCTLLLLMSAAVASAQLTKVYDEQVAPLQQIEEAVAKARSEGHFVVCQVGGNWCPWCLKLAAFVEKDSLVREVIAQNFEYIHVNYPRRDAAPALMQRLHNPGRFGYPALVVLDGDGQVLHIQDSSFLEEGSGYDAAKVLRFLKGWTPAAVKN